MDGFGLLAVNPFTLHDPRHPDVVAGHGAHAQYPWVVAEDYAGASPDQNYVSSGGHLDHDGAHRFDVLVVLQVVAARDGRLRYVLELLGKVGHRSRAEVRVAPRAGGRGALENALQEACKALRPRWAAAPPTWCRASTVAPICRAAVVRISRST